MKRVAFHGEKVFWQKDFLLVNWRQTGVCVSLFNLSKLRPAKLALSKIMNIFLVKGTRF